MITMIVAASTTTLRGSSITSPFGLKGMTKRFNYGDDKVAAARGNSISNLVFSLFCKLDRVNFIISSST